MIDIVLNSLKEPIDPSKALLNSGENIIKYKIASSSLYIFIGLILILALVSVICVLHRNQDYLEAVAFVIVIATIAIVFSIIVIFIHTHNIIKCLTIPELIIKDFLQR